MSSKSSPERIKPVRKSDTGHTHRVPSNGHAHDSAANWSATLSEIHIQTNSHVALRNKPEAEKAKNFIALLADVVEGQVIPRLMLAHKAAAPEENIETVNGIFQQGASDQRTLDPGIVEPFATLVLNGSVEDLEDFVVQVTRDGFTTDAIYLDLMAPAARLLGQYWEDDKCSFTDVTLGLGRLQTLLYRLSAAQDSTYKSNENSPKALFLTPEGSQHSLGVRMVEELFREAGWRTICEINTSTAILTSMVRQEAFDLVGIGLSTEGQVAQTRDIIHQIRAASQNPAVQIILGGKLVIDDPSIAARVGADLFARDGKEAIVIANKLLYKQTLAH